MIGMGSMGQPISSQMARHGVATAAPGLLRLIDGDVVSERNLIGTEYRQSHVGQPKAQAAAGMIQEINHMVNLSSWNHVVKTEDVPQIVDIAGRSDLLGLFADDFDTMMAIADRCSGICPQVMAVFGTRADFAEVAFSVPGLTPPLTKTLGKKSRTAIRAPSALGCDTLFVSSFVAALCLRLLLGDAKGSELLSCYANAPLFAVGLRKVWLFAGQPEDVLRTIVCVDASQTV